MKKLVSIIIPVYNREHTLLRLFDSLVNQDYRPLEIVLVDNGSSDSSFVKCDAFRIKHYSSDFKVVCVEEKRQGASAARNTGLRISTGEYIYFFDSDDEMSNDFISEMSKLLDTSANADIALARTLMIFENGRVKKRVGWKNVSVSDHILASIISTQSFLSRRSFITKVGEWNEKISFWVDYELGVRILLENPNIVWNNNYYHRIYQHSDSITGESYSSRIESILHSLTAIKHILNNSPKNKNTNKNLIALYLRARIIQGQLKSEGAFQSAVEVKCFTDKFDVNWLVKLKGDFLEWYRMKFGYGVWMLAIMIL